MNRAPLKNGHQMVTNVDQDGVVRMHVHAPRHFRVSRSQHVGKSIFSRRTRLFGTAADQIIQDGAVDSDIARHVANQTVKIPTAGAIWY